MNHYLSLCLVLLAGVVGLYWFQSNSLAEQLIIWAIAAAYFSWGIFHHMKRKDLTGTIVLEYLLLSLFAGIVVNSLLTAK